MFKRMVVGAALVVAVAAGATAVAFAAIPDGSGVIHGCYKSDKGDLRVIDPLSSKKDLQVCKNDETSLNWGQTGPQGAQGPQGVQGPQGPVGPQGPPGAAVGGHVYVARPSPAAARCSCSPRTPTTTRSRFSARRRRRTSAWASVSTPGGRGSRSAGQSAACASGAPPAARSSAVALFDEIGSTGWAEDARNELSRVGACRPSPAGELTKTEERIARLAADGLSNKEIVAALVVTVTTVEGHLTKVYSKLGVRPRSQLASRLSVSKD